MTPKYTFPLCLVVIVLLLGLLALTASTPSPAYAGPGLPPRDTPAPPTPPRDDDKDRDGPPVGAYIELAAPDAPTGAWTAVQWHSPSDGRIAGGWHDVDGWCGSASGGSRWWVHPKDFGTGPFRWVVKTGPEGSMWGVSDPFHLPGQPNETLRVEVSPNP